MGEIFSSYVWPGEAPGQPEGWLEEPPRKGGGGVRGGAARRGGKLQRREMRIAPGGALLPGRCCDGAGQGQEALNRLGRGQGGSQQPQQGLELGAVFLPALLLFVIP